MLEQLSFNVQKIKESIKKNYLYFAAMPTNSIHYY